MPAIPAIRRATARPLQTLTVLLSVLLCAGLSACATSGTTAGAAQGAPSAAADARRPQAEPGAQAPEPADPSRQSRTAKQIGEAVTTPLSDLNVVRAEIPPVLAAARRGPYAMPGDATCAGLAKEIEALDAALGADLDTPPTASNPGLLERGTDAAGNYAVGAVRGAAQDVVPFRSWVRKLSGAERYSREISAAIAAGGVRRSFLKGIGQANGCSVPAAPRRPGSS